MKKRSNLPIDIHIPCVLNLDRDQVFMIGSAKSRFGRNITLAAYILNLSNDELISLADDFPCEHETNQAIENRFTCANLRHERHFVIVGIDNCIAILNLTSLSWTSHLMPFKKGILLNVEAQHRSVFYIGHDKLNQTDIGGSYIYKVT